MQIDIKKEFLEKMGFADSYLIKVLEKARTEAQKVIPCQCREYNNHKLIFLTFGDPNSVNHYILLTKPRIGDLKFDSYIKKEFHGMALYFSQ